MFRIYKYRVFDRGRDLEVMEGYYCFDSSYDFHDYTITSRELVLNGSDSWSSVSVCIPSNGGVCCYQLLKGTESSTNNFSAQVMMCWNSVGVLLDGTYEFYVDIYELLLSNWIGTLLTKQGEDGDTYKLFDPGRHNFHGNEGYVFLLLRGSDCYKLLRLKKSCKGM